MRFGCPDLLPTSPVFNTLNNASMRIHVRLRLGLVPVANLPANCYCQNAVRLADAPSHIVSCAALMHRSGTAIVRHTLVGQALTAFLREAGISAVPEMRHLNPGSRERPDLLIHDAAGQRILTDHTIIDTLSAGRLPADGPLRGHNEGQIRTAEQRKRARYAQLERQVAGAVFRPLVLCVHGLISDATSRLLHLRDLAADQVSLERYEGGARRFISDFVAAVACAVAKGNAHIATNVASIIRHRAEREGDEPLADPPTGPEADFVDDAAA